MAPVTKNSIPQIKAKAAYISPIGKALFCSYPNASQFDSEKMEASLVISAEQKDAFMKQLAPFIEEVSKGLNIPVDKLELPIKDGKDKDGNPDGNFIVKAKTGISFLPRVFDSVNTEIKPDAIPNGSDIRLKLSAVGMASPKYKGIVFRLSGIQVLKLVEFSSGFDVVDNFESDDAFGSSTSSGNSTDWE